MPEKLTNPFLDLLFSRLALLAGPFWRHLLLNPFF
jgi:hypothetical protein